MSSQSGSTISNLTDRNANTKLLSPPKPQQMTSPSSLPPKPHHTPQQSYNLAPTSTPHPHSNNPSLAFPPVMSHNTKYDLSHSNSHLHSSHSASYLHSNNLAASSFGNVKSESTPSYDYMNNCLPGGYFGGSFGAPTGGHSATDLAGYHHQHNVIQAAKLMASS